MESWEKLPLNHMDRIAQLESYNRYHYRPIYSLHKWWARRPGSTFRILCLAGLTDKNTTKDDILRVDQKGAKYSGRYLQSNSGEFNDKTILDPFAGGGTTLVEANRLGVQTLGYEINPVAWWIIKKSIDEVDHVELQQEIEQVLEDVRDELMDLFTTTDPETGQDAEILYSFQSQRIKCVICEKEVNLFNDYILRKHMATRPAVVFCPNEDCCDRIIELDDKIPERVECPRCSTQFDPKDGNSSRGKFTCDNGHKHDIGEVLKRHNEKPTFDYYTIKYTTRTGEKKFKEVDEDDKQAIRKAEEMLDEEYDDLPLPTQKIPQGDKTSRLTTRGFEQFVDVFSARHLLTYGKLFNRVLAIEDENIREFVLTGISNSLIRGSYLTKWDRTDNKPSDVFARQSYIPRTEPVEANPLNTEGNVASVENFLERVVDAKEYCNNPFEKMNEDGDVVKYPVQNEKISEDCLQSLNCKTSEDLGVDDESVDLVITDPPYYDNVQYSELSEYFYVWLHQVLKDEYEQFRSKHTPSAREIVANSRVGKDEEFFVESLTNVFTECNRVLKDDGELIFTYHHNDNRAWNVILQSLVESGFTITGAYPVQSEMPVSVTIRDLENAEYDIIIFANKESIDGQTTLQQLQQELFFELQEILEEERERQENLSKADLGVILRGRCLYYYSKYYPRVYKEEERVNVEQVLDTVDGIIEQVLEGSVNLPRSLDSITQGYAAFCQRGPEEHDDLNKQLLAKNLNMSDLKDEKLVKGPRNRKEPVPADERIHHIERKISRSRKGSDALLDVDKVQYLYHLYKTDQNTAEYLREWKSDDLQQLAEFLADATGDERYENVMEMSLSQF